MTIIIHQQTLDNNDHLRQHLFILVQTNLLNNSFEQPSINQPIILDLIISVNILYHYL